MHRHTHARLALVASLLIPGCSKPQDTPATAAAAAPSPARTARAMGRVVGKAPAPSSSGAVVVVLEPRTPRAFAPQRDTPVMDQVGLSFGPELLLVRTGQPVEFRNSDDTLHNVHVSHDETREPAFNVAIPTGESYSYIFKRDGFYRVGCDIHPSMAASIFATTTPFSTLADSDGRFSFADVPSGPWTVTVYAAGRRLRRDVDVDENLIDIAVE